MIDQNEVPPTKPLLRYHGGKWRIAPWIISQFPEHRVYVEVFGGAASVLLQKTPTRTEIYNDLDTEIVNLMRVLRDRGQAEKLHHAISLTLFSRDEYATAYEVTEDPVERARRTIVKSFFGMGSKGIWTRSGFDVRVNPDAFVSRVNAFRAIPDVLLACVDRLQSVVIENCDAIGLIDRFGKRQDCLLYLDPPYVRTSYGGGGVYRHRYTDDDHRVLAEKLGEVKAKVAISGYPSELYSELFAGWRTVSLAATADSGSKRTEVLWMNYEAENPELF